MYLVSASSRLMLYDVNRWDLKKSYGCYDGLLRDVTWSDEGKYILQVNSKGVVEILNANEYDVRCLQHIHLKDTWSACFHRDGHRNVAVGTKSGSVMVWDTKTKTVTKTFPIPPHQSCVNHLSYNSRNSNLAAAMQNGETIIYGLASNVPVLTIKLACSKSITAMKFHHESRSLLGFATDEGHIVLRDITTNKDKNFFENIHASPIGDFAYSLVNKDVLLSCGFDKVMHIYDIRLQNIVSTTKTSYILTSLSINLENQVALGTKTGAVIVYDLRNLTNPLTVLQCHEEEIRAVGFQPIRIKTSGDVSLREDCHNNTGTIQSPKQNRSTFLLADTSPIRSYEKNQEDICKVDSFLEMLGLDKSISTAEDGNKSLEFERKSDGYEMRYKFLDVEKNISKVSTPLNSKVLDSFGYPSPVNGVSEDVLGSNAKQTSIKETNCNEQIVNVNSQLINEMKDFVKLTISDVADDNRNYFLHTMMALTKQKLFLEKKIETMNDQITNLAKNQNILIEMNRMLALEVELLKSKVIPSV